MVLSSTGIRCFELYASLSNPSDMCFDCQQSSHSRRQHLEAIMFATSQVNALMHQVHATLCRDSEIIIGLAVRGWLDQRDTGSS